MSSTDPSSIVAAPAVKPSRRREPRRLAPYHVVLLNDDDHTYAYVIEMLRRLFAMDESRAFAVARQVDSSGRAVVLTTHRELAELKRDQILQHGADWRVMDCAGSMSAVVEPAPK